MSQLVKIGGLAGLCMSCWAFGAKGQSFEAQQLLLDWQKLSQQKELLNDLYKGYEILSAGYIAIRDISKGSFDLHKAFLDRLLAVSSTVRNYKRVAEIITLQERIVSFYKTAWARFRQDPHFSPDEVQLMGNTYSSLLNETLKNLETLTTVLTDGALRASDGERLRRIDGIHSDMQVHWMTVQSLNNQAAMLSLARAADEKDEAAVKQWYGLTN